MLKLTPENKNGYIGETMVATEIELRVSYIVEELSNKPLLLTNGWNALHAIMGNEQYTPSTIEFERVSLDELLEHVNDSVLRDQISCLQKELEQLPGSCTLEHNCMSESAQHTIEELITAMQSLSY